METIKTLMTSIIGILIAILLSELYYIYLDKSKQIKQEDKISKIKLAIIVVCLYELFLALFFLILSLKHILTHRFGNPHSITETLITIIFSQEIMIVLIIIVQVYFFYLTIKKRRYVNYRILDIISIAGGTYLSFNFLMLPLCFLIIYVEKQLRENFGTLELTFKTLTSLITIIVIIQITVVYYIAKIVLKGINNDKYYFSKLKLLITLSLLMFVFLLYHFNGIKTALMGAVYFYLIGFFAFRIMDSNID